MKRAEHSARHQLVKRIINEENEVLPVLQNTEKTDGGGESDDSIALQRNKQRCQCAERQNPQRQVPHIRVAKIHRVFQVAHHEITGRDKQEHEELMFLIDLQWETYAERHHELDRADEKQVNDI